MKPADEVSARAAEPAVPAELLDEDVQEEQTWLQRLAGSNVWIFLILGGIWADRLPRHRVMVDSHQIRRNADGHHRDTHGDRDDDGAAQP